MKVLISWSGEPSRTVAHTLRTWLPLVIQSVKPWVSEADIKAGARWGTELSVELNDTKFGIICLTRSNQRAPWIMFEAGALAKTLEGTYVVPYLIDLNPADVEPGPLTQFQAKRATRDETWALVQTVNSASEAPLQEVPLSTLFDVLWPQLEKTLAALPQENQTVTQTRTPSDMLEEVLNTVREIARRNPGDATPEIMIAPRPISHYADVIRSQTSIINLLQKLAPSDRYALLRDYTSTTFPEFPLNRVRALYEYLWPIIPRDNEVSEQTYTAGIDIPNDKPSET